MLIPERKGSPVHSAKGKRLECQIVQHLNHYSKEPICSDSWSWAPRFWYGNYGSLGQIHLGF